MIAILLGDTANVIGFSAEPATTWRRSGTGWSPVPVRTAPEETGRLVAGEGGPVFVGDRSTGGRPDRWVCGGGTWGPAGE